jgi:hypothetical protein
MAHIHRTPEQWLKIFKQHTASGMQIATFCKQQKLNTSSFYAWRKRLTYMSLFPETTKSPLAHDDNKADWVNMMPEHQASSQVWDIELALPNGVVLRMMNS